MTLKTHIGGMERLRKTKVFPLQTFFLIVPRLMLTIGLFKVMQ